MFINGAGAAFPASVIDGAFLESLGIAAPDLEQRAGITRRYSTLSLEWIQRTRNTDLRETQKQAQESVTELGARAAMAALECAGIVKEEIGLLIGESLTPPESTPSEGQRVAGRLGLKIPSFDIVANSITAAIHLIRGWKKERLAQPILLVGTNGLTQRVDYSRPEEAGWIGDGAYALVLSPDRRIGFAVRASTLLSDPAGSTPLEIDTLGYARRSAPDDAAVARQTESVLAALDDKDAPISALISALEPGSAHARAAKAVAAAADWSIVPERGILGGAAEGAALAAHWNAARTKERVLVLSVDGGPTPGGLILERV